MIRKIELTNRSFGIIRTIRFLFAVALQKSARQARTIHLLISYNRNERDLEEFQQGYTFRFGVVFAPHHLLRTDRSVSVAFMR